MTGTEEIRIVALFGVRAFFGAERANVETLASLRERGCAVLCVVRDEDWPELIAVRDILAQRGLEWVKVPQIDYPIRGWILHVLRRNPGVFIRSNRALPRIVHDFRATHIHAFNPFHVASFRWALSGIRLPLIYRSGDRPALHNAFYRSTWSFVKRRATHFVADSKFIAQEIASTGVEDRRISVIYAPAPRRSLLKPFNLPAAALADGAFRIVYVGQIMQSKGVEVLVDAFLQIAERHENAHLVVAGRISEWRSDDWARNLRSRARSDPRGAHVHFAGFVENAPGLIRQCHLHVAPTISEEPYGLVVVEAKEVGRPSIIFRSGGMSELVTNGVDGCVLDEKTATNLATAIEGYVTSPEKVRRHGEEAFKSISVLGIPEFGKRWKEVYATVNK
jgi:glycosyltransferase involved in cell wall biosynthesis